jgi:hypothetical protein
MRPILGVDLADLLIVDVMHVDSAGCYFNVVQLSQGCVRPCSFDAFF